MVTEFSELAVARKALLYIGSVLKRIEAFELHTGFDAASLARRRYISLERARFQQAAPSKQG